VTIGDVPCTPLALEKEKGGVPALLHAHCQKTFKASAPADLFAAS